MISSVQQHARNQLLSEELEQRNQLLSEEFKTTRLSSATNLPGNIASALEAALWSHLLQIRGSA